MGVIVTFNYAQWVALFPQFAYLGEPQAQQYFDLATAFNRNDGGGPVCNAAQQTTFLNLVTAHLAQLLAPSAAGQPASDIVGRIANATQGSVTVGTDNQYPPGTAQWWQQTKYGSMYWTASAPFRTARYIPGGQGPVEPWPYAGTFFGQNWGGWGR